MNSMRDRFLRLCGDISSESIVGEWRRFSVLVGSGYHSRFLTCLCIGALDFCLRAMVIQNYLIFAVQLLPFLLLLFLGGGWVCRV